MNDIVQPTKITISGRVGFEQEITASQAAQIIAFIDQTGPAAGVSASVFPLVTPSSSPPKMIAALSVGPALSPREALDASGAKTNAEKIVAFALCIAQEGDKDTFKIEDIKPLFRRTRETPPKNFSRDLAVAIRAGWVVETDVKNEYFIASKVSDVLEVGFEGLRSPRGNGTKIRAPRGRQSNGKPSRKTAAEVPEAFKGIEAIEPVLVGVIDFHKLTKQVEKFVWTVYAAKQWGVSAVSNQEVVWLSDKLGDCIPSGSITKTFQSLHKAGYLNRTLHEHKIRITSKGEEYLKALEK
ncbi:hypothetical protein [Lentzea sp. NPDC051838]|uniref:hypothetical protein n=1 Tax=Lentzea sp. NPDC051838 TaxID=3154849 RepID=UPI003436136C